MKILITGSAGMLGTDLVAELKPRFKIAGSGLVPSDQPNYTQSDLSVRANVSGLFKKEMPDLVIHTAAMTDVDGCETRREDSLKANYEMTRLLADAANEYKARLLFFSTDYIFSGMNPGQVMEDAAPDPVNYYGETKLLAENYIKKNSLKYVIFRITWLYGLHGKSFPRTMLELVKTRKKFEVVDDQKGRPTYTKDVARAFSAMLEKKSLFENKGNTVYHLCNTGEASWADFAEFIFRNSGYPEVEVARIDSTRLNRAAKRPFNSVLSLDKVKAELGICLRPWQEAILEFIADYQKQQQAVRETI